MSHFAYFVTFVICASLVQTGMGYKYWPEAKGWVARHPVMATWDEALLECRAEEYKFMSDAVLMSPTTSDHLRVMQSLIDGNTSHYVGTRSMIHPRLFVSVEGIALSYMAISDILEPVEAQVGLCVAMDRQNVYTASCSQRLPFMCYKEENKQVMTECGTFDQGYKLNNSTGSCYKYHSYLRTWTEAYWICATEGGYLAVINNEEEAQAISKLITNRSYYASIGLRDWQGEGDWLSIHRDRVQDIFHIWYGNKQPSSPCCKVGAYDANYGKLREWTDVSKIPFLCEKNPNNIIFPRD